MFATIFKSADTTHLIASAKSHNNIKAVEGLFENETIHSFEQYKMYYVSWFKDGRSQSSLALAVFSPNNWHSVSIFWFESTAILIIIEKKT